jgi:hypothetical protein
MAWGPLPMLSLPLLISIYLSSYPSLLSHGDQSINLLERIVDDVTNHSRHFLSYAVHLLITSDGTHNLRTRRALS